jgi:hypothetical protein
LSKRSLATAKSISSSSLAICHDKSASSSKYMREVPYSGCWGYIFRNRLHAPQPPACIGASQRSHQSARSVNETLYVPLPQNPFREETQQAASGNLHLSSRYACFQTLGGMPASCIFFSSAATSSSSSFSPSLP